MAKGMMNGVMDHIHGFMDMAEAGLKDMQSTPIGTEPRSKRERTMLRNRLNSLPPEEQASRLQDLIAMVGPTEVARFINGAD